MTWYLRLVAQAGFGNPNPIVALAVPISLAVLATLLADQITGVTALGVAAGMLLLTLMLEALKIRSSRRARVITEVWPEVVDSIQSALQSGMTISNAFSDLAVFGPSALRRQFSIVSENLSRGVTLNDCLNWLRVSLATEVSDRTIEILRLLDELGGHTSIEALGNLSVSLRKEIELSNELDAKQGWVVTTSKLGLIAPWVIVWVLSRRSENLLVYNSTSGFASLLGGLFICLVSYLAIQLIGAKVQVKRVFDRAIG